MWRVGASVWFRTAEGIKTGKVLAVNRVRMTLVIRSYENTNDLYIRFGEVHMLPELFSLPDAWKQPT